MVIEFKYQIDFNRCGHAIINPDEIVFQTLPKINRILKLMRTDDGKLSQLHDYYESWLSGYDDMQRPLADQYINLQDKIKKLIEETAKARQIKLKLKRNTDEWYHWDATLKGLSSDLKDSREAAKNTKKEFDLNEKRKKRITTILSHIKELENGG